MTLKQIRLSELHAEMCAQVERLLEHGVDVTHLDSHKHIHLHPSVARVMDQVARRYRIAAVRNPVPRASLRVPGWSRALLQGVAANFIWASRRYFQNGTALETPCPDDFYGFAETGFLNREFVERVFRNLRPGVSELMTHPGRVDSLLENVPTRLRAERELELELLIEPQWKERIATFEIHLGTFRVFRKTGGRRL